MISCDNSSVKVCVSGGQKLFFGKFGMLCFLETPVLRFALLPYYRPYIMWYSVIRLDQSQNEMIIL